MKDRVLSIVGLIIAIIAIVVSVFIPEIRDSFGLANEVLDKNKGQLIKSKQHQEFTNKLPEKDHRRDSPKYKTPQKLNSDYDFEAIMNRGLKSTEAITLTPRILDYSCVEIDLDSLSGELMNELMRISSSKSIIKRMDTITYDVKIDMIHCFRIKDYQNNYLNLYKVVLDNKQKNDYYLGLDRLIIMEKLVIPGQIDFGCSISGEELNSKIIIEKIENVESFFELVELIEKHSYIDFERKCSEFIAYVLAKELNPTLVE